MLIILILVVISLLGFIVWANRNVSRRSLNSSKQNQRRGFVADGGVYPVAGDHSSGSMADGCGDSGGDGGGGCD